MPLYFWLFRIVVVQYSVKCVLRHTGIQWSIVGVSWENVKFCKDNAPTQLKVMRAKRFVVR